MTPTTHAVPPAEIMAYLHGQLPPEPAAAIARHLEDCSGCRSLAADLRAVSRLLLEWKIAPVPEAPRTRPASARAWWRRRSVRIGIIAAAVIAIAIPAAWQIAHHPRPEPSSDSDSESVASFLQQRTLTNNLERETPEAAPPASAQATAAAETPAASGPMIVRTAQLTLVTKQIDAARAGIERIVAQDHGYVAQLEADSDAGSGRTLTATVRVPAAQLDAAMAELKKLGQVAEESQNAQDITSQYVDLQARLDNAHHTEDRLIALLAERTGNLSDVLDVEKELSNVREEIERMEAERKTMQSQIQFASVDLKVSEEYDALSHLAPLSVASRLRNAVVEGWSTALAGTLGAAVLLLNYGPSLIFLALLLFWPARWAWRRRAARVHAKQIA